MIWDIVRILANSITNKSMQMSIWQLVTTVNISIKHKTLANLESITTMGSREGFLITLDELEKLLS